MCVTCVLLCASPAFLPLAAILCGLFDGSCLSNSVCFDLHLLFPGFRDLACQFFTSAVNFDSLVFDLGLKKKKTLRTALPLCAVASLPPPPPTHYTERK